MQRKAQFYVFDAFFAAAILLLGIGFLITEYTAVPDQTQTQTLTFDVAQTMTGAPLEEIFTNYTIENYDLLTGSYTPAQQVQEWWHNESCSWCMDNATALTGSLIAALEADQHGINITIRNDTHNRTFYSKSVERQASLLLVNQQLVLTGDTGPDVIEVKVWR